MCGKRTLPLSSTTRTPTNVTPSETQADFTTVSESLHVPFIHDHAKDGYTIRVGIEEEARKGAKR
jgi:hypothetical protein